MQLSRNIGTIISQLNHYINNSNNNIIDNGIKNVTIKTWGGRDADIVSYTSRQLLLSCVLQGILTSPYYNNHQNIANNIDIISVLSIASNMNINTVISNDIPPIAGSPFFNLIEVTMEYNNNIKCIVTGSVYGSRPHIVNISLQPNTTTNTTTNSTDTDKEVLNKMLINTFDIQFSPDSKYILLFIKDNNIDNNTNNIRTMENILSLLSNSKINVAGITVSKINPKVENMTSSSSSSSSNHDDVMYAVSVDDNISETTMNQIKSLSTVKYVTKITL
jgi:hypothetical protein